MDSGKGMTLKSAALQVIHFTTAKQQVTPPTTVSFVHCGCGHEHNIGTNSDSITEEVDFCKDCIQLGAKKEADVKLSHLQTMSFPCAVLHLCDDCEGGGSSEEEAGDKYKPKQC
jgi:plastocyanin